MKRIRVLTSLVTAWFAFAGASFGWAPVANNDAYSTTINTVLSNAAPGVLANDTDKDSGTVLRAVLVSTTTNGVLALATNGAFTYRPGSNFFGTDSFTYKASDGSLISGVATVTITVNPLPATVTKAPTNNTVCPGANATFSVTATGTSLRYQWRFGTNALAGQTNNTLVLSGVTSVNAGTYSVVVSGVSGSPVTNSATLTVNTLVSATALANAVRSVGGVVIFSTTASGTGPISYQWKKNGTNLDGKITSSLVISNLAVTDIGTYSVAVTGPCNSVTPSATLDVDYCFPAVDVALVIDRSGSMQGQPFADAKTASSNFVKNLKFGVTNDRAALISYATTSTLDRILTNNATALLQSISNTPAASGYTCISCGIQTAQNELASVRHNSNAMPVLVVMSDGLPTAGDTGSNAIYQATLAKNAGTRVFTVGLGDVDHALMRAIASSTNDYFYTTNSAQLTALFNTISEIICRPPTNIYVFGLTNQTVCSGSTVAWSVNASNCAAFTYQWRKDGVNLAAQTNRTLTIPNVAVSNAGIYSLVVGSSCQTLTNHVTLTVNQSLLVNTPPASQAGFVGSNATFSINAIGTGISYQWFFNGAPAGTGSTLALNNLTTNQAGTYCVVISGVCGAPITNCAMLTILNRPPTAQPDSYRIMEDVTLTVPAPGVLNNDSDPDGDMLASVIVTAPVHGAVTLNENGSFVYRPNADFTGTDTFAYRATDTQSISTPVTVTIDVTPVNDGPIVRADSYQTGEDMPLTITAPGVLANDTDTDGDALTAILVTPPAHGTMTLNANGSFTYVPNTNFYGTDIFTYKASDGVTNSREVLDWITVTPVNDAPLANNDSYTVAEDTTLTIAAPGVLANDTDVDGNSLTAILVAPPSQGTLTLNANGSFTYVPSTNFTGMDTFTYKASDGTTNSGNATVTISVTPVNDAPAANNDAYTVAEDTTLTIAAPGVLANDTDVDGDTLTSVIVSNALHGVVTLNADGSFTYKPSSNYNGPDSFLYRAYDTALFSEPATVTINVTTANDPPVANNDGYSVSADAALTITAPGVLANDTDVENNALTAALVSNPAHGSVVLNANGSFVYVPGTNFSGSDSFTYRANDGQTNSNPATVTISVIPNIIVVTNPPADHTNCPGDTVTFDVGPTGTALTYQWYFGTNFLDGRTNQALVLTNITPADSGDYCVAVFGAAGGPLTNCASLVVNLDTIVTAPPTNRVVCPGETVPFTVTATGTDLTFEWYHGSALISTARGSTLVLSNVTANDAGIYTVVTRGVCGVFVTNSTTLTVNETVTIVTPPTAQTSFVGSNVTFSVVAAGTGLTYQWFFNGILVGTNSTLDLNNLTTNRAGTYCVVVSGTCGRPVTNCTPLIIENRPPFAKNDSYSIDEDSALNIAAPGVLANDGDIDGDAVRAIIVTQPVDGYVTLNADGSFSYLPNRNFNGTDSFTYKATDARLTSAPATVTITVKPINDAPIAVADSFTVSEDHLLVVPASSGVLTNDFDLDDDIASLRAILASTTTNGVLQLNTNGGFTYLPNTNFFGVDHFTYRASDGRATSGVAIVTITVSSLNDAPTVSITSPTNGNFFTALANIRVTALASDVDGVVTNVRVFSGPALLGSFATNAPTILLSNWLPGVYTFRAVATDNGGLSATSAIVSVTVTSPPLSLICANTKTIELGNPWSFDAPAVVGGCGTNAVAIVNTVTNPLCGATYTATRTWRATDQCGNNSECSQLVVVVDTTPPTLTSPSNKVVELGTVWTFDPPTATDLSGATVSILSTSTNAGTCGNGYIATRVWIAADGCGNTNTASQVVTVLDRTAPAIACATNKTVELGTPWTFDPPTATDLSSNAISIVNTVTNTGTCGSGYVAIRTWRATDACGNSNQCSQVVTVLDRTAPAIVCSTNKVVEMGSVWNFDPPTASDLSSFTISIVGDVKFGGGCLPGITRTWRATDACGNSSTCSQTVYLVDRTAPTMSCATNKTVELGSSWTFDPPTAQDLNNVIVAVLNTVTNAGSCGNGFVATRTWRATDDCGNSNQCSQVVTVVDRTAPAIACPANKSVEAGLDWAFDLPTVSDLSSFTVAVLSTTTNQSCGGSYVATRVWSAMDSCGNSNTCSQVITVRDSTAPEVSIISPTNGQVFIAPANISIIATAFDAGGVASVRLYANSNLLTTVSNVPYFFDWTNAPLGSNGLRAVATDFCGQSTTSSIVTVYVTTNTLFAAGPIVLNRQNGLYEQYLSVSNLTAETWPNGVRVFVDVPKPTGVWNATGTNNNGVAYIDIAAPVAPGGTIEVLVQYFVPNAAIVPSPNIVAVPLPYARPVPIPPKILSVGGGQFGVTFRSENNRWYYLQFSDDLAHWKTLPKPVNGTGAARGWNLDKAVPCRFYRVLVIP